MYIYSVQRKSYKTVVSIVEKKEILEEGKKNESIKNDMEMDQ